MASLDYSRYYTYEQAAQALGVSVEFAQKWIDHSIKQGLVINGNGKELPVMVSGAALRTICMKRYGALEAELIHQARLRIDERDRAELRERDEDAL